MHHVSLFSVGSVQSAGAVLRSADRRGALVLVAVFARRGLAIRRAPLPPAPAAAAAGVQRQRRKHGAAACTGALESNGWQRWRLLRRRLAGRGRHAGLNRPQLLPL